MGILVYVVCHMHKQHNNYVLDLGLHLQCIFLRMTGFGSDLKFCRFSMWCSFLFFLKGWCSFLDGCILVAVLWLGDISILCSCCIFLFLLLLLVLMLLEWFGLRSHSICSMLFGAVLQQCLGEVNLACFVPESLCCCCEVYLLPYWLK